MGRVQVVSNHTKAVSERIEQAVNDKTVQAFESLRDFVVAALEADGLGIKSDTYALAKSLYVAATGRDDYQAARAAALQAFQENPSRHRDRLYENSVAHFEHLLADREELPGTEPHVFVCALVTMVSYGGYWETRGKRYWVQPATFEWIETRAKGIYEELKNELNG